MVFYDNEILNDLEVEKIYTEKEISSLVSFKDNALKDNVIILCEDTNNFNSSNIERKYKVIERLETYLHKNENGAYRLPVDKSIIYKIIRVY